MFCEVMLPVLKLQCKDACLQAKVQTKMAAMNLVFHISEDGSEIELSRY